uniref:Uncharacterized protein n=1 Tax=Strigamia maritima TaxID=126957 RepID=T1J6J9_STRMM
MESEGKQRTQRNRLRRERAARMQQQKDSRRQPSPTDEGDESPGPQTPIRPPIRKKRSKEPLFEEDIIDGFAIISFRTYEDLEWFNT